MEERKDIDIILELFDELGTTKANKFYISHCAIGKEQIFDIDLSSIRICNDEKNNINHNVVFKGNMVRYETNNNYVFEEKKDIELIGAKKTVLRMLKNGGVSKKDFIGGDFIRIMFKVINHKNYELIKYLNITKALN